MSRARAGSLACAPTSTDWPCPTCAVAVARGLVLVVSPTYHCTAAAGGSAPGIRVGGLAGVAEKKLVEAATADAAQRSVAATVLTFSVTASAKATAVRSLSAPT